MAKYSNNDEDGIRRELLELINHISSSNEDFDTYSYKDKLLDVTGSLGCWGIVQLDTNGNIKR